MMLSLGYTVRPCLRKTNKTKIIIIDEFYLSNDYAMTRAITTSSEGGTGCSGHSGEGLAHQSADCVL
jgi:hypothetical protein